MVHPEHLLLGMLFDSRKYFRCVATKIIIKARETLLKSKGIFRPPQVYFEAKDYIDLIDWQSTSVTKPVLINKSSKQELELMIEIVTEVVEKSLKFLAHTSSGENYKRGYKTF